MQVRRASLQNAKAVAPLFDAYRAFYDQPSDLALAERYLIARLEHDEAVIFLCEDDDKTPIGFTLLYPTFCSVAASKTFVLYDLFVADNARRRGVGTKLLTCAQEYALQNGAVWLKLETAIDNAPGQALYEKLGWERDEAFHTYHFSTES